MKALLYFLTFRWIKAYRYATKSEDAIEIMDFEAADPQVAVCTLPLGVSRRKLIKALDKLCPNYELVRPLGIDIFSKFGELPPGVEEIDRLIEKDSNVCLRVVTGKVFEDYAETRESFMGLSLRSYTRNGSGVDILNKNLVEGWYKVQIRKGNIPSECPNCHEELEINPLGCCYNCDIDMDDILDTTSPSSLVGLYEDIVAYEQGSGKDILERVS